MLFLLIILPGIVMGLTGENSQCHAYDQTCDNFPVGDARNCHLTQGMMQFEALTGTGWDNILNKEMGQVLQRNYSRCLMSEDRKYLIPDHTFLIPIKRSDVNIHAEYFSHWSNYTDITATGINVDASFSGFGVGVSGSFSKNYKSMKSHMVQDQSKALRVQLRYHRYTMKTDPRSPSEVILDQTFQQRLLEVAAHIQKNDTDMARYLSDLIVRDYGTHYITSVDAGGVLAKEDTVRNHYVKDRSGDMTSIKTSASISLFSMMKVGFSYQHMIDKEQQSAYERNCTFSHVLTYGGPVFGGNFSVNEWVNGLENSLVAVDRSGEPLHQTITADNFPTLPDSLLYHLSVMIEKAITHYYEFNTYPGCTDPNKSNFAFAANVDDGTCAVSPMNFTFGGSFQKCVSHSADAGDLCQYYTQKNPLTNGFSCPPGYEGVQMYTSSVSSAPESRCHKCGWLHRKKCCTQYTSRASYQAYWCAATGKVDKRSGYMFGGFFSKKPKVPNPLTKDTSCPATFYPIIFLGRYTYICISDDYELGYIHSVPFAGVYSCMSGNPLFLEQPRKKGSAMKKLSLETYIASEGNPKQCPEHYSQHLLIVEGGCEVNYCVQSGSLSLTDQLPNVRRPPFIRRPPSKHSIGSTLLEMNSPTEWLEISPGNDSADGISSGTTAGIAIGVALMIIFIAYGIIWGFSIHKRKQKNLPQEVEQLIVGDDDVPSDVTTARVDYGSTSTIPEA